jgi:SAM-dependent methyltransferase
MGIVNHESGARYDRIGTRYRGVRVPEPRIAALIEDALGDAVSVLNVGAGAGSYESPQRKVVALEPSETMIYQRAADAAPAIRGTAEVLPFADASVDACTAFLTVHHWTDQEKGLRELRRVARKRIVILTYVAGAIPRDQRWLTSVYFPGIAAADERLFPRADTGLYQATLGPHEILPVPIPSDCVDGFLDAYWARPEAYLDPAVRAGISGLQLLPETELREGLERLERDLADGSWESRLGYLRTQATFDAGLRLVVAGPSPVTSIEPRSI